MANNPATLQYDDLQPGEGPRFGVVSSQSEDFTEASGKTIAWFISSQDAFRFAKDTLCPVWDLELGVRAREP